MKRELTPRFVCAVAGTPFLIGVGTGALYYMQTGATAWLWLLVVASYVAMLLVGLPISAILIHNPTFVACVLAGMATSTIPVILISMLSLFSRGTHWPFSTLLTVAGIGAVGGVIFWTIAFSKLGGKPT